jgi:hypothetical protein
VSAPPLSAADRIRRDKIVGLLGSAHEGERSAALNMLQKMADAHGLKIHELLIGDVSPPAGSAYDRQRAEQDELRAREAELRAQRAEQAARYAPRYNELTDAPDLPSNWRAQFTALQQFNISMPFLTNWETGFVSDVLVRRMRSPSPKQAVVILRIIEKATRSASRSTALIGKM